MKLYSGLLEGSTPTQPRIFGEAAGKLVDLQLARAAYLAQTWANQANAYELAAFQFPASIAAFLERWDSERNALDETASYTRKNGASELCGPAGEKIVYEPSEIRLLPPVANPERSFVIGFSDRARTEALPRAEIPTGYYKLPQTFVTGGAPILWPKFSNELDADACLAIVIGKAGRRIDPSEAWNYVAGATLLIDVTARDINRREGLTTNNLLGKNFPSSTSLGPSLLFKPEREMLEGLEVELTIDGQQQQKFCLSDCVFSIEQIIARWSILGIKPGDFFAIGASMALKGDRLQNPAPVKIGSVVRCSSPLIGELCHTVVAAGGMSR